MIYDQNNPINQRRLSAKSTNNIKSHSLTSSISLKRQASGHIPLLNAHHQPLLNSTNLPQRSIVNVKSKRKNDELENDSFEYDVPTSNYASVRKPTQQMSTTILSKRPKSEQSFTPKKFFFEDGSLRLVTSTIQGMKHWSTKNLPYPIVFEVFGKLDSQVSSNSSSNTRQFSLIDEKDRIECIFAEIDQTFSNIDRDVQLRIICRVESGQSFVRCLNIRVATKDEWQERRDVIRQSDAQLNDDDAQTKKLKKSLLNNKK